MKRKGLIVSSIVMVIVLIASLTTATYAWFSASSIAEIQNIQLSTVTSEGLEIGVLKYPGSYTDVPSLTVTGAVTISDEGVLSGDQTGSSSAVKFTNNCVYMGVSGNGAADNMWSAYGEGDNYIEQGGTVKPAVNGIKPNFVGAASPKTYFGHDFLITDTKNSTNKLVIQKITIKATNSTKEGLEADLYKMIAASARIAIFAAPAADNGESGIKTYVNKTRPPFVVKKVIEPYYKTQLSNTGTPEQSGSEPPQTKFLKDVDELQVTASPGDGYVQKGGAGSYAADYSNLLKAEGGIKDLHAGTFGAELLRLESDKVLDTIEYTTAIELGAYDATHPYIAVRVAVWFEGEDAQCIADFAKGSGINVSLEFAKKA